MSWVARWIARVGPCGLSPVAPGTVGSLAGVLLFWFLGPQPFGIHVGAIVTLFGLGTWACHVEEQRLHAHDLGEFVIDEVVGVWITLLVAPWTWKGFLVAFLLFRVFDILKPFPIRSLDLKVPGGFGVMVDDVLAGVYGAVALVLLLKWTWFDSLLR